MDYLALTESSSGGSGSSFFSLIVYAALILGYWILFMKADEPGWMSLIPFLNTWIMFKLAYGAGWKCLLLLVPILNIVIYFAFNIRFAQAYGKGVLFGIGLALLPNLFTLLLAFGRSTYQGPATYGFL